MPDRPQGPRRPDEQSRRTDPAGDDALTFDTRRGSRGGQPRSGRPGQPRPGGRRQFPTSPPRPEPDRATLRPGGPGGERPPAPRAERPASGAARRPAAATRPGERGRPTGGPTAPGGPGGPRGPRPGGARPGGPGAPRRRHRLRTAAIALGLIALLWIGATLWAVNSAWNAVNRVDATPSGDRPNSDGRNVLLVGSDSREGLTKNQRKELGTGTAEGARTDSIMVLHTGGDRPTLLSIPRDSYVDIPGHGKNKINAAFALGGPKLLAQTIEQNTGLRMDGYMEIGFGGFATVVDAVDGVNICVKRDMDDPKAHINLKKGCQDLDGPTALGYVRARYSDPEGDLGRAQRQRQFLGALMGKVATPTNMMQPWKVNSLGKATAGALTVGEDDSLFGTARAFWGIRAIAKGDGNSVTVPISNPNLPTPAGTAVEWDPVKSKELFAALRENRPLSIAPGQD